MSAKNLGILKAYRNEGWSLKGEREGLYNPEPRRDLPHCCLCTIVRPCEICAQLHSQKVCVSCPSLSVRTPAPSRCTQRAQRPQQTQGLGITRFGYTSHLQYKTRLIKQNDSWPVHGWPAPSEIKSACRQLMPAACGTRQKRAKKKIIHMPIISSTSHHRPCQTHN